MLNSYSQLGNVTAQSAQPQQQSAIESSLNNLFAAIDVAEGTLAALVSRLSPIQASPSPEAGKGESPTRLSACALDSQIIEAARRIDEMTAYVRRNIDLLRI